MFFTAVLGIWELGSMVACLEDRIPFSSYNIINPGHFSWSPGITLAVYHEENNTIPFDQAQIIQDFIG